MSHCKASCMNRAPAYMSTCQKHQQGGTRSLWTLTSKIGRMFFHKCSTLNEVSNSGPWCNYIRPDFLSMYSKAVYNKWPHVLVSYWDLGKNVNEQRQDCDEQLRSSASETLLQVFWHGCYLKEKNTSQFSVVTKDRQNHAHACFEWVLLLYAYWRLTPEDM